MKSKFLIISAIASLLFYFLFPFIDGGELCYPKDPDTNKRMIDAPGASRGIVLSLAGYTAFLLTEGQYETNNGICVQHIP